jgi:hypothetical protein
MEKRVVFNGVEYASAEDMPPDVRYAYEQVMVRLPDKDGDGVPDAFQGAAPNSIRVETHSRYVVNGREYRSPDEMPPDARALYESARSGDLRPGARILVPRTSKPGLRISCGTTLVLAAAGALGLAWLVWL